MKKIALFGGSFDPVHLGHLDLAKLARETAGLDRVIFMPCWQSPFKNSSTVATGEQRHEMLQRSIDELDYGDWAEVSDFEITRPKRSYSWETTEYFRATHDDVEWYWIMGTDQWKELERWAEPDKLRRLLKFIVMTRNGDEVEAKEGWEHIAVPFSHPASATLIRKGIERFKEWLPDSVYRYSKENSIYTDR